MLKANLPEIAEILLGLALGMLVALILFSAIRIDLISAQQISVFRLISQGLHFCWRDRGIRLVLFYLLLGSFFIHGPLIASLPLLAKTTLMLSEASFGGLYAMTDVGTIAGATLAILLKPEPIKLGAIVLGADFLVGLRLVSLGLAETFYAAALFIFLIGVSSGLVMIAGTTWFQLRTPSQYMGRVMSILMFCVLGTVPVSASLSGYIIEASSVAGLMVCAGGVVSFITVVGLGIPSVRAMGGAAPLT